VAVPVAVGVAVAVLVEVAVAVGAFDEVEVAVVVAVAVVVEVAVEVAVAVALGVGVAPVPVHASATVAVWVLCFPAWKMNVSVPETGPGEVGWHSTSTWQVWDAPNEPSQVSDALRNGADVKIAVKSITAFLELLVANTLCGGLVVPIATLPKSRFVGLSRRCAFPFPGSSAKAGRDMARPSAKSRMKLRIENAKRDDLGRDMDDPPKNSGYERLRKARTSLFHPRKSHPQTPHERGRPGLSSHF
jgi:hypothetical protein